MRCPLPDYFYHTKNHRSSCFFQVLNRTHNSSSQFRGSLVWLSNLAGRPVPLSLARSPTTIRRNGSQKPLWVVGGDELAPKWYPPSTTARAIERPTNTIRINYWGPIIIFVLICSCLFMPTHQGVDHTQIPNRQTGTTY